MCSSTDSSVWPLLCRATDSLVIARLFPASIGYPYLEVAVWAVLLSDSFYVISRFGLLSNCGIS